MDEALLGYVMGVCPLAISNGKFVDPEEFPQLISSGAELEIDMDRINRITESL